MSNDIIPQPQARRKAVKRNNTVLVTHPELREFVIDLAEFTQKHKPARIAELFGLSKQNVQYYLNKRSKQRRAK